MTINDGMKYELLKKAADVAIAAGSGGSHNAATLTKVIEDTFAKMIELATKA